MIRRVPRWLRWMAPAAAGFFIGRVIYLQWQKVQEFDWRFEPLFLLLSFGATSSWFLVRAFVWRTIVAHFGRDIPYRECLRIFVLSEMSRYVPGTVWQYFSRIYLAGQWGVPAAAALTSALMELLLLALAAGPLVLWRIDEVFPILGAWQRLLLAIFPVVAVIALHPAMLNRVGRLLFPRLKMQFIPIELRFREIAGLWAACLFLWIAFGSGFVLFARSLAPLEFSQGLGLMSNYAVSWLVGLATLGFAPGGIGVREGVLGFLLESIFPLGTALLIAVLSRLWLITLEAFWAAVSHFVLRLPPPGAGKPDSPGRGSAGGGPTSFSG